MSRIRVLLVDDHMMLREGLCELLRDEPDIEVVGEAEDGEEAVRCHAELHPDVVLMDIGMDGLNGFEATRRIKRDNPHTQILALTVYDRADYVFEMLKAGAAGYVLKRAAIRDLILAIRAVHRGDSFLHPSVATPLIQAYLGRQKPETETMGAYGLTPRQLDILRRVAEGASNQMIADALGLSIKTVQTHRAHLMERLQVHDRTGLVRYAIKLGLTDVGGEALDDALPANPEMPHPPIFRLSDEGRS